MKQYELMTITDSAKGEEVSRNISNGIRDSISRLGGKILDTDSWGNRKFAYPVNKQTEGFYEVLKFELDPKQVESLNKELNLTEGLVRFLLSTE